MQVWKNSLRKYKFYKIAGASLYFCRGLSEVEFNTKENFIIKDGKCFAITKDNFVILLDKVNKSLSCIVDDEKINIIELGDAKLLYKRRDKTKYAFMLSNKDNVLFYEMPLSDFLKRFNLQTFESLKNNVFSKQAVLPFYESAKQNGDKYAVCLIDYLSGRATKEDVDFLNEYENGDYLLVDREVYGAEDITDIRNLKLNRRGSMFGWRISYDLECKIDGRYYKMKYFPSNLENVLHANCPQVKIKISPELNKKLKVLTGETEDNIRTRKLMQLGNFLYESKKSLSKEQIQKVLSDFSKVSLKDLQSMPIHWIDKIDQERLYDWLHGAGLQEDKEASDYVASIVNERKERYVATYKKELQTK